MTATVKAMIAAGSVAALAFWVKAASRPNVLRTASEFAGFGSAGYSMIPAADIDDDTAADIIRRARPALERARQFRGG